MRLVNTPIRRLEGITYWVNEDPDGIADLINTEVRREWEEDTQLVDGYCRYATLKAMNISRTYVYAGTLKKRALDRKREKDNLLL